MEFTLAVLFWFATLCFLQTWFLYPLVLWLLLARPRSRGDASSDAVKPKVLPAVTVVLPIYNAASRVCAKLESLLALDYPAELLDVVVVTDGCSDNSAELVRSRFGTRVRVIEKIENRGKSAAQNAGISAASAPFLLLTDVDARLDGSALWRVVRYFDDPSVGCVGVNIVYDADGWESSGAHGIYWRIENRLRVAESQLGVLISICGSAFAVRSACVRRLDEDTGDDFIIPLDLALQGYKTVYAPDAIAHDHWPSRSSRGELHARRRMTLRNLLALMRRRRILNPLRYPGYAASLISHKLLRWLSPISMMVIFATCALLSAHSKWYLGLLVAIAAGTLAGLIGLMFSLRGRSVPVLSQVGAFLWANLGMFLGLCALFSGRRINAYDSTVA